MRRGVIWFSSLPQKAPWDSLFESVHIAILFLPCFEIAYPQPYKSPYGDCDVSLGLLYTSAPPLTSRCLHSDCHSNTSHYNSHPRPPQNGHTARDQPLGSCRHSVSRGCGAGGCAEPRFVCHLKTDPQQNQQNQTQNVCTRLRREERRGVVGFG